MIYYRAVEKKNGKFEAHYRHRWWPFWSSCYVYQHDSSAGPCDIPVEYDSRDEAVTAAVKHGDEAIKKNKPETKVVWATRRYYDE
jgi:hypothetical protein